jgi:hypothetical protein
MPNEKKTTEENQAPGETTGSDTVERRVIWRDSSFGEYAALEIPDDADIILVSIDLMQHKPQTILLPHQMYRKRLKAMLEENPGIRSFTIHPLRSKESITIDAKAI